ncbi:MAG TPA: hypothetical protein VFG42_27300 [Baekduia sp.]|uniref:hypothetical protein n=1 Tax=Baekduia sp. TaxID=2600305 RepID=UPI002D78AFE5|nr:hypothetical protein [Baekduia sp.]HET6510533.1 hypothetical protein [Baekduia sp.]
MGLERRSGLALGAAIAAASAAIAGCGGTSKDDEAAAPAKRAATTEAPAATTEAPAAPAATVSGDPIGRAVAALARQKGGLAVAMHGTIQSQGVDTKVSGTGSIDRRSHRGAFTVTTVLHGAKIAIKTVMDGHAVYLSSPAFAGRLQGGRSWMRIDLAKAARQKGFDLSSLGTNGPSQDPSQVLDYLRGAGPVKKLGTAKVRGTETTHYRVTVDLRRAKAKSSTSAAKLAITQLVSTLDGATKIPVEVWIDGQHRVLRERVRYTAQLQGAPNAMDYTTDFTGFDVAVKASAPKLDDTVDGLALLAKAQQAKKEQQQANEAAG